VGKTNKPRNRVGEFARMKARRIAANVCIRCGKNPPITGKIRCEPCTKNRDRASEYKRLRARRLAANLCMICGKVPPGEGRVNCKNCTARATAMQRKYAAADPKYKQRVKKYDAERAKRFAEAGLCVRCGKRPPHEKLTKCEQCGKRDAARVNEGYHRESAKRRQAGRPLQCTEYNRTCREEVIRHYGPNCQLCGEAQYEFLTIDHVGGGGRKHRKSLGFNSSIALVRWLKQQGWPEGFQTLCYNCNIGGGIRQRRARLTTADQIYKRDWVIRRKLEAFAIYGGVRCVCCGCEDEACLTLDHINGDGTKHRKEMGNTTPYKWLKEHGWPKIVQVMCFNCNCGKRNGAVCPHQRRHGEEVVGPV
jgi:hypothetical protein